MRTTPGYQNGPKIQLLRKQRGLTVREVAETIGLHPGSVRNIELGRGTSIASLRKLARLFDVSLEELLLDEDDGEDRPEPADSPTEVKAA